MLKEFITVDSTKWSPLHSLLLPKKHRDQLTIRHFILIYVFTVMITFLVPFLLAWQLGVPLWHCPEDFLLPFLKDVNVIFMSIVTIPFLLILLSREPSLLKSTLLDIQIQNVIECDETTAKKFTSEWAKRYKFINLFAVLFSLSIEILVITFISYPETVGFDNSVWTTYGAPNGKLNLAGWSFMFFQSGLVQFLFTFCFIREITVVALMVSLTTKCQISVHPLHPDQAGGLREIGTVGLHNQLIVVVGGVNIAMMFASMNLLGLSASHLYGIVSISVYALLAPIAFAAPLLPFRPYMLEAKRLYRNKIASVVTENFNSAIQDLEINKEEAPALERVQKLKALSDTVDAIPEWPLDTRTLRHFTAAFLAPTIPALFSWLLQLINGKYGG